MHEPVRFEQYTDTHLVRQAMETGRPLPVDAPAAVLAATPCC